MEDKYLQWTAKNRLAPNRSIEERMLAYQRQCDADAQRTIQAEVGNNGRGGIDEVCRMNDIAKKWRKKLGRKKKGSLTLACKMLKHSYGKNLMRK